MRSTMLAVVLISAVTNSGRADEKSEQLPRDQPSPLTAPFDAAQAKAAQEAWAKSLGKPSPVEKNSIGMDLVLIPPGRFRMGSPLTERDRQEDEVQTDVTLTKAFYLGRTEVTQAQWQAVMGTTPRKSGFLRRSVREGDDYAAPYLSWKDATEFCRKLSERENAIYRLPTEAEWEYACRGGQTARFSFGDREEEIGAYAWYWGNTERLGEKFAEKVRRNRPNPFGLYDMHGNVREWCDDFYHDELPGGIDPLVANGDSLRVLRGGGWTDRRDECRSARRFSASPEFGGAADGFRVARSTGQ